ncbi:hypothetical protein Tco_0387575, partial [Tanacetum coccineum]
MLFSCANNSACMSLISRLISLITQRVSAICAWRLRSDSQSAAISACSVGVPDVPGYESYVHTHDHDGSKAPEGSPNSILSSEPKPLGNHRPPPPPSILSPGE